jgi:hypothetical protein
MKRVAELVGVEERFLNRATRTRPATRSEPQRHAARVHKRFYVTLALHDLIREVPLDTVAHRYGASRGMLQGLQGSAATFSGMVTIFCHKLGWNNMEMLLSQFQNRLTFGVERELCDLVRISSLNAFRARVLYGAGYHTVTALASASSAEVEKHLRNATPFQSNKNSEGESETELRRRMRAKCVWVKGRKALTETEAAQEIVKEACALMKEDALKLGMAWKPGVTIANRSVEDSKAAGVSSDENVSVNHHTPVKDKDAEDVLASEGTLETSEQETYSNHEDVIKPKDLVLKTAESPTSPSLSKEEPKGSRKTATPETSTNAASFTNVSPSSNGFIKKKALSGTRGATEVVSDADKLRGNKEITSDITRSLKGTGRETPRKKRDGSLKRRHSISKSPKDCNGPKVKLSSRGKLSEKPTNAGESAQNATRSKNEMDEDQQDNFFSDCLDNFKMKEHGTPSKKKGRGVLLLESSIDTHKSPSRKASTMNRSKKYSNTTMKNNQDLFPETSGFSKGMKTPRSDNLTEKHLDLVDLSKTTCVVNEPRSSSVKTPTGKQCEIEDESPELITSNVTSLPAPEIPLAEIEYKSSPNMSETSPELYSEALFSEQSFEMQIAKMSENLDVQNPVVPLKEDEGKTSVETKGEISGCELHTPRHDKPRAAEEDLANLTALCTPGMFDSEMCFSQFPMDNEPSPAPHRQSPGQSGTSPEQSRRSSEGSFSLRLSQSFECPSDSDLSSRTLAAVEAVEEKEMIANQDKEYPLENQGKKGHLKDKEDNEGHAMDNQEDSDGFQEVSNMSLLTLAAIEAIDEELRQNGASNLEKTNNKQKNESDASRGSRVSSANEIQFTEIKPRSSPTKSAVTTGSGTSSEIAVSSVKRFLKKTQTESSLSFDIKDVDKNQNTFKSFVEDCRSNSFSFSVALEKRRPTGSTIGRKFNKGAKPVRQKPRLAIEGDNLIVVGVAVCWGGGDVCFLSLENEESDEVSWQMKMESLRDIMALHVDKRVKTAFGIKEQFKVGDNVVPALSQYLCFMLCLFIHNLFQVLSRACGVVLKGELHDPKIAAWLLDPGAKEKNFLQMVEHFLPQESNLLQGIEVSSQMEETGKSYQHLRIKAVY